MKYEMESTGKIRMIFSVAGFFPLFKYVTASGIYFTILIFLHVRYIPTYYDVQMIEVFTLSMFM